MYMCIDAPTHQCTPLPTPLLMQAHDTIPPTGTFPAAVRKINLTTCHPAIEPEPSTVLNSRTQQSLWKLVTYLDTTRCPCVLAYSCRRRRLVWPCPLACARPTSLQQLPSHLCVWACANAYTQATLLPWQKEQFLFTVALVKCRPCFHGVI